MMKRIALAALLATGLAVGAAQAQAPLGTGGNVVGGVRATMTGGGEHRTIHYSQPGAGGGADRMQAGRLARFVGGHGDGLQIEYLTPAPAGTGREAWLVGGGENAEVVYARPR